MTHKGGYCTTHGYYAGTLCVECIKEEDKMSEEMVKGVQGINIVTGSKINQIQQEALDLRNKIAVLYCETVGPQGVMGFGGPMNPMSETLQILYNSISQLTTISRRYNIPIE
jgi:hypothetical protein